MKFIKWLFRNAFEAEYHAGYRDGAGAILEVIRRTKLFIAGDAPVAGLNAFLAKETPHEVSIVGCHFGELSGPISEETP